MKIYIKLDESPFCLYYISITGHLKGDIYAEKNIVRAAEMEKDDCRTHAASDLWSEAGRKNIYDEKARGGVF